jgi:hypothetical protein
VKSHWALSLSWVRSTALATYAIDSKRLDGSSFRWGSSCSVCNACAANVETNHRKRHTNGPTELSSLQQLSTYIIVFFFYLDGLGPSGLFPFRIDLRLWILQTVGLVGRMMVPSQGSYLHRTTQTEEMWRDIHASIAIRTHDPSAWAGEDISCLRPPGHCDRPWTIMYKKMHSIQLITENFFLRMVFILSPAQET